MKASELISKFQQALDDGWGYIFGTAGIPWTAARQKALEKTTDSNRAMGRKYGSKWIGHTVADCSGMFRWAYAQFGEEINHSVKWIWRGHLSARGSLKKGKRSDGKPLLPGTAIFTGTQDDHPHIGLYVGDGYIIEAKGTVAGVVRSPVNESRWTWWGELKEVDYDMSASDENQGFPDKTGWRPTIRRGSKGKEVEELQTMLYKLGYDIGVAGIDGDYGRNTEKAVKDFQSDHRLGVDGVCGPLTWDELDKCMARLESKPKDPMYTVCIHHLDKTQADAMARSYPGCVVTEE